MSISTVIAEVFNVLDGVTELARVYAVGKTGDDAIPDVIGDQVPAAIVYPGESRKYEQGPSSGERHEYTLEIQVFVSGADTQNKLNTALPIFDAIRVAFQAATALNDAGSLNQVARLDSWRFGALTYAGETFTGWAITLFISEDSPANYSR